MVIVYEDSDLTQGEFGNAIVPGAIFNRCLLDQTDFVGADLRGASFLGAAIIGADFSGALLHYSKFAGARYTSDTIWPQDFDPERHGAELVCEAEKAEFIRNARLTLGNNSDDSDLSRGPSRIMSAMRAFVRH